MCSCLGVIWLCVFVCDLLGNVVCVLFVCGLCLWIVSCVGGLCELLCEFV